MNSTIYQHPTTVSDLAVDAGGTGKIATSCYDGNVRLFASATPGAPIYVEKRANELNCVALRGGTIASDADTTSGLKEGVAVDGLGNIITAGAFGAAAYRIIRIDASGRFGLSTNQLCYDRTLGVCWRVVPEAAGFDKWPMALCRSFDSVVIASQDKTVRFWYESTRLLVNEWPLPAAPIAMDVAADGARVLVADENCTLSTYTRSGVLLKRVKELSLVHGAAFLADGRVVYGTHDGRLCVWDGVSDLVFGTVSSGTTASKTTGKKR